VATGIPADEDLDVPGWVVDINSFRRWVDSPHFPNRGRIWWLCGKVWADMSREQLFTHNAVKTEITTVLHGFIKAEQLGRIFSDGILLSSFEADISGKPDAMFVSFATLDTDKVRLVEGKRKGYVEVQGAPDMVLEVLSQSSGRKDTVILRKAYWLAGIPEYWLVDARKDPAVFEILRHTARGYVTARDEEGWVRSAVFGKSFRFEQITDRRGQPDYLLRMK
jgi:Uma2 family endonuclease